ncbi:MAG: hypothetical protein QG671_8, partial [Actinomycetota bacterium]|nr:hypothetical protein [Actinomycetota bacterium]
MLGGYKWWRLLPGPAGQRFRPRLRPISSFGPVSSWPVGSCRLVSDRLVTGRHLVGLPLGHGLLPDRCVGYF